MVGPDGTIVGANRPKTMLEKGLYVDATNNELLETMAGWQEGQLYPEGGRMNVYAIPLTRDMIQGKMGINPARGSDSRGRSG